MSAVDPFAPGQSLLHYRLVERVTSSVWKAEDTRSGKAVALKILSRQLPKDPTKRDTLVREVRQGAALYHSFLANIVEIVTAGDALLLIMEWVDGKPLTTTVRGKALDRAAFFRLAYQIVDATKLLHAKNVIHGNIAGDSILITASDMAKLSGLNLMNLMPRREGQISAFQQKGNDARAVGYMAPEQITNQPLSPQTDIFSLGLVLYEAATGRLPYQAPTAGEIARKVVDEQPPSPKSINPAIDNAVLGVIGRALFKDPFRRHKDAKAMLDEIVRADPEAAKFAAGIVKSGTMPGTAAAGGSKTRSSILFVADVENYDTLHATDPGAAKRTAARMQQVLGEAVYLFDGEVVDPFGPRMIAEMPNVENALEAGRKGEFDFSAEQQGDDPIAVRLLLHAGEVETRDGAVVGPGVTRAVEVLRHLPPLKLHITEDFTKRGRGNVRMRDSGARGGVKLYTIVPPEPKPQSVEPIEASMDVAAEEEAAAVVQEETKRKGQKRLGVVVAAVVIVVVLAGAGVLLWPKRKAQSAVVTTTSTSAPVVQAPTTKKVLLEPITVEGADPALPQRANAIRLAALEVLRAFPEISIASAPAPDVNSYKSTLRIGAAGPEIVTGSVASPAPDAASGIRSLVHWVADQLHIPQHGDTTPEAYNALADAVTASAANDVPKTEAALRAATKADPNFLPAELLAMRFFTAQGKDVDAIAAARQVMAANPNDLEAPRVVARGSLRGGDVATALGAYGSILRLKPSDPEALNIIGRYAVSAGDTTTFSKVLQRLSTLPDVAEVHEPDMLLASGKIEAASDAYYTIEEKVTNNPALSLKIGRLAVLRHSAPIAELQLKKLQQTDPIYGLHLLKAYVAAQAQEHGDQQTELASAFTASRPGDEYWTSAAEIAAISGDTAGVIAALEHAADREEPTAAYIMASPLFGFLQNDERFLAVRQKLQAQQSEVRTALASLSL
jgi:cytochrome c-type biogenesis protein CcmH/NrfG